MPQPSRIQFYLTLPYKHDPIADPLVRAYLDRGYRIVQFQRLTDRDAVVTIEARA